MDEPVAPCWACMLKNPVDKVSVIHTQKECLDPSQEEMRLGYWTYKWFGKWTCEGCYGNKKLNPDAKSVAAKMQFDYVTAIEALKEASNEIASQQEE